MLNVGFLINRSYMDNSWSRRLLQVPSSRIAGEGEILMITLFQKRLLHLVLAYGFYYLILLLESNQFMCQILFSVKEIFVCADIFLNVLNIIQYTKIYIDIHWQQHQFINAPEVQNFVNALCSILSLLEVNCSDIS